jgi:hypothetical protein
MIYDQNPLYQNQKATSDQAISPGTMQNSRRNATRTSLQNSNLALPAMQEQLRMLQNSSNIG